MRIYQNFKEMFSEVWRDVFELGVRSQSSSVQNIENVGEEYDMMEILGYAYELTDINSFPTSFKMKELDWLREEFAERISPVKINPGKAWRYRAELWKSLMNMRGAFDYTYNERIRDQLPIIIDELRKRPNTRQAVMTIYSPIHYGDISFLGGFRRIPCSLSYQFLLRNRHLFSKEIGVATRGLCLNVIYNMRSCDVATHFKFDAALACMLLNHVAGKLDVGCGSLIHTIGSLHCFKKDSEGVF